MPPRSKFTFWCCIFWSINLYWLFLILVSTGRGYKWHPSSAAPEACFSGCKNGCDVAFHKNVHQMLRSHIEWTVLAWLADWRFLWNWLQLRNMPWWITDHYGYYHYYPPPPQCIYYIANLNEKPKHIGFLSWINITSWKETSSTSPTSHTNHPKTQQGGKQLVLTYPHFQKSIILIRKCPPLHISSSYHDPQAYNVAWPLGLSRWGDFLAFFWGGSPDFLLMFICFSVSKGYSPEN